MWYPEHYLEFAGQGPTALGAAVRSMATNDYDSEFEMSVAEGLRRLGWTVRKQIGVSKFRIDLGVIHPDAPGKFLAGIKCDGATYHSSPSARDRDRVRHIILERLGWQLFRVWSTDWFIDPVSRLQKLNDDLKALLEEDCRAAAEREANTTSPEPVADLPDVAEWEDEVLDEDERSEVVTPEFTLPPKSAEERDFEVTGRAARVVSAVEHDAQPVLDVTIDQAPPRIDPARFHEPSYRSTIRRLAVGHIAAEAPITAHCIHPRAAPATLAHSRRPRARRALF